MLPIMGNISIRSSGSCRQRPREPTGSGEHNLFSNNAFEAILYYVPRLPELKPVILKTFSAQIHDAQFTKLHYVPNGPLE